MVSRRHLVATFVVLPALGWGGCGDPVEPQGEPRAARPPAQLALLDDGPELERMPADTKLAPVLPVVVANRHAASPVHRVQVEPGEPRRLELTLQNGYCFRVTAVAPGMGDIDLFLYEPDGTPVQQDTNVEARPVLGMHRPICPEKPTPYRLEVLALHGGGLVAFQVFTDRPPASP